MSERAPIRHLYACTVHLAPACIEDLVRNLRHLDGDSGILIYNGGEDAQLLQRVDLTAYDVLVHPAPVRQHWGQMHGFVLDALRFALSLPECEAVTFVDSDQLCVMRNYGAALLEQLRALGPDVGLLSNKAYQVTRETQCCEPTRSAFEEWSLFESFVRRFPNGENAWVWHTFWPAAVITRAGALALTRMFEDRSLQQLMNTTRVFATEEVLLPTFIVLAGLRVCANPFDYRFIKFRVKHNTVSADLAILRKDIAFIHPVAREYDDPVRGQVRKRFGY